MIKRALAVFLLLLMLCPMGTGVLSVDDPVLSAAEGIISWKKSDNGEFSDGYLINDEFLLLAGTTPGDWYPIGLSRLGKNDNYSGYLAVIRDRVEERYRESGKLSAAKATEWHRISLAILACGGDPTSFGTDDDGNEINLIADGTYDRGKTTPLGRQGINGWIWGLITLDSMRYTIPDGAYYSRDDIIVEILSRRLSDGGFALSGKNADPDITAMALQALSPYYNSEKTYTYVEKETGKEVTKSVYTVVEGALDCLSKLQLPTGDFASWGTENVESTDQVTVALCCLGIDPLSDERFIKEGNTLLDGILRYRLSDGGFVHSYVYDEENPTSLPDKANTMAGEQTLYTMAALWRQSQGLRTLYDFRKEQSSALKARISSLEEKIGKLSDETDRNTVELLMEEYYSIPEDERSYVYSYRALSNAAKKLNVDILSIAERTEIVESPEDLVEETVNGVFTEDDRRAAESFPEKLTTKEYVLVVTLLDKLCKCDDFEGKDAYLEILQNAKNEISKVQSEIDSLNSDIKKKLYPFDSLTLADKKTVDAISERYYALSEYDRGKIFRFEDVVKTKTRLDNLFRGIIIAAVLFAAAAVITVFLVMRIRKRRRKKETEMAELSARYEDEE